MGKIIIVIAFVIGLATSSSNAKQIDNTVNDVVVANDTCKAIDNFLTQLAIDKFFSGGLLIIIDGKKIFSEGYGWTNKEKKIPFTPTKLASMKSITKTFTAAAIMKLNELRKISVNYSLLKFFSNVPDDKTNVTIHQLLTHSTGFNEFLMWNGGDYEKIEMDNFFKRAFSQPLSFKPAG